MSVSMVDDFWDGFVTHPDGRKTFIEGHRVPKGTPEAEVLAWMKNCYHLPSESFHIHLRHADKKEYPTLGPSTRRTPGSEEQEYAAKAGLEWNNERQQFVEITAPAELFDEKGHEEKIVANAIAPFFGSQELDTISNPAYYKRNGMEAIDVIEAFDLGYHLGNAFKYLCRRGQKGPAIHDLQKARWYIEREIARLEGR